MIMGGGGIVNNGRRGIDDIGKRVFLVDGRMITWLV